MDSNAIPRGIQTEGNAESNATPPRPGPYKTKPPQPSTPSTGTCTTTWGLRSFEQAPASVQAMFWRQIRQGLDSERVIEAWVREYVPLRSTSIHEFVRWDGSWDRRARAVRRAALRPEEDWTPDRDADPLVDIPARVYIEALTGEEVPANGSMCCPLPDHDDFNPSFRVYDGNGWRCFGCGESGSIYDLASHLWGIPTRGRDFVELHKRLRAVFA